jgi:DNA helicase II / ATP-dependent DNA helicase PcrA
MHKSHRACQNRFKEAIKELGQISNWSGDKSTRKKEALKHLSFLLEKYNYIEKMSLIDFYSFVKNNVKESITNLNTGKIKTFYESHTYQQLATCVKITEDKSLHRTIHKSKGDEFENVLLVLKDSSDLSFLLNPDLEKEEHRINYVAVSRAKKRLFISVPTLPKLSNNNEARLYELLSIIET